MVKDIQKKAAQAAMQTRSWIFGVISSSQDTVSLQNFKEIRL
jgi:hypothetical protein